MRMLTKQVKAIAPAVLLLFLLMMVSVSTQAKEFYATVMRDFAINTQPEIELTYSDTVRPFQIRIMKPRKLEDFVAHEVDIRRAWKQPEINFNSAKYLIDGFNSTNWNYDWIRLGLDSSIRENASKKYGGGKSQVRTVSLDPGPKKIIRIPAGFDLVQEITFVPQDNVGKQTKFDVPGFEWFSEYHSYDQKIATVKLPTLPAGVYVVQFIQGRSEGQAILVVNDVQAEMSQSDSDAIYRVADRNGRPIEGAEVAARSLDGKWVANAKTDGNGVCTLKINGERDLVSVIQSRNGPAIIDSEFLPSSVHAPDVFMLMDRPLYHPTDKMLFKGIARELKKGESVILKEQSSIELLLEDSDGAAKATSAKALMSDYGSFQGEFSFIDLASGLYRTVARIGSVSYAGESRVKEFKKPSLRVEFLEGSSSVKPGSELVVPIKISRYSGEPVGPIQLQADLQRIRSDGPEWIESVGAGETGSEVTYGFDRTQHEAIIPIPVMTEQNISVGSDGSATVHMRVPADLPGPSNFDYKLNLLISATDSDGSSAGSAKSYFESADPIVIQSKISASMVQKNSKASLELRAVSPSGEALADVHGSVSMSLIGDSGKPQEMPSTEFKTDQHGKWRSALPTGQVGQLEVKIRSARLDGAAFEKAEVMLIADEANAQPIIPVSELTLLTKKTTYEPSETAKVLVVLPKGWSAGDSGLLHYTLAGESILEQKTLKVSGRAAWIDVPMKTIYGTSVYLVVSYPHPSQGWIERKVSFRIMNADRILSVQVNAVLKTGEPGADQQLDITVTDKDKKGVQGEVAVSVVDEALLALQGDFRPKLIDFFYPVERLNLASFFSSDFQGYGYGETIAKLFKSNFSWAATKSNSLKQEDTAYWNPAIETDSSGHAKVTFRLPANNTTWKVSAVVIDKKGRFGEGQTKFDSHSQTPLFVALPNMMRVDDQGLMRLTARNNSISEKKTFDVEVLLPKEMKSESTWKFSQVLTPGEELEKVGQVQAIAEGDVRGVAFDTKMSVNGKPLNFTILERLRSGDFASSLIGEGIIDIPQKAEVESLTVHIADGFSGTVLGALDWLIHYPYGCAEQLTSATIPNLVLARLLVPDLELAHKYRLRSNWKEELMFKLESFWTGVTRFFGKHNPFSNGIRLTDHQEQKLKDASLNAATGLRLLRNLQMPNGSFQWFEGTGPDRSISHLVLFSLLQMNDLESFDFKPEETFNYLSSGEANASAEKRAEKTVTNEPTLLLYDQLTLIRLGRWKIQPSIATIKTVLTDALKARSVWSVAMGLSIAQLVDERNQGEIKTLRADLAKAGLELSQKELTSAARDPNKLRYQDLDLFFTPNMSLAMLGKALFLENKLDKSLKDLYSNGLANRLSKGYHYSTFETAQVLMFSQWLISTELHERSRGKQPKFKSLPDGLRLDASETTASLAGWDVVWNKPSIPKSHLEFEPDSSTLTRLQTEAKVRSKFKDVEARSEGQIKINRKFYVLKDGDKTEVTETNVKAGDVLYIELSMTGLNSGHYYVIENEVPGGTTWLDEDRKYTSLESVKQIGLIAKRDTKTDVLRLFVKPWRSARGEANQSNSDLVAGGVFRVENAGVFTAGVGRIRDFYSAEQFAQTGSTLLHFSTAKR